jgi:hypothetical protein
LNEVRTFPVERSSRRRVESREEIRIVEGEVGEGVREVIGPAGTAQTTKGHEAMRIERRCLGEAMKGEGDERPMKSSLSSPIRRSYSRTKPSTEPVIIVGPEMTREVMASLASLRVWMGERDWDLCSRGQEEREGKGERSKEGKEMGEPQLRNESRDW